MTALLAKDLYIQKKFIFSGFFIIWVFFILLGAFNDMSLALPAAIYSQFLINAASKTDEKNNSGLLLNSLPLTRRHIVSAKYMSVYMFTTLCFSLTALSLFLTHTVTTKFQTPTISWFSFLVGLTILAFFYSVYFPLYFKFGKQLIQMLDVIVIVVLGLGLLIISKLDSLNGGYLTRLTETLQSWSHYELVGAMIAFQIVFMGISYLISMRLYDHRDL